MLTATYRADARMIHIPIPESKEGMVWKKASSSVVTKTIWKDVFSQIEVPECKRLALTCVYMAKVPRAAETLCSPIVRSVWRRVS